MFLITRFFHCPCRIPQRFTLGHISPATLLYLGIIPPRRGAGEGGTGVVALHIIRYIFSTFGFWTPKTLYPSARKPTIPPPAPYIHLLIEVMTPNCYGIFMAALRISKLRQRYREWWEVLREEGASMPPLRRAWMLILLTWHALKLFRRTDTEWRRKIRHCHGCILYDKMLKRCRPYTGSLLGCGCYVPYMAKVKKHCWGKENLPDEGIGW